jgi:hypothetical protein
MTAYDYAQLEGLWDNAGGNPSRAPVAAAVAEAESSGNADATSSNPDGGTNVGLWQLDTPGGKGAGHTVAQLEDPATNAAVAVTGSSDGADWSAWQTFVQGTYLKFLQSGVAPDTSVATPAGGPVVTTSASGGGGIVWYEPWTWFSGAASDATSTLASVGRDAARFAVIGGIAAAGGVLVLWGLGRATGATARAQQILPAAAGAPLEEAAL